jgi:hypothetical protein
MTETWYFTFSNGLLELTLLPALAPFQPRVAASAHISLLDKVFMPISALYHHMGNICFIWVLTGIFLFMTSLTALEPGDLAPMGILVLTP